MCEELKHKKITSFLIYVTLSILFTNASSGRRSDETFFLRDMLNTTIVTYQDSQKGMKTLIDNEGCRIPYADSLTHSLWNSYRYPEIIQPCFLIRSPLLKSNESHVWLLDENLPNYNVKKFVEFECCYQAVPYLVSSGILKKGGDKYSKSQCIYFQNSVKANDEYVRITCRYNLKVIYEQFFVFVVNKPFTRQRPNSFNAMQNPPPYNVVILGLSSISRANFHRTMRRTSKFLKERGAIELFGYNRVADSTFSNLMPVLTGMNAKQLKETCWPNARTTLDSCFFIWERFKDEGYYTAYFEDSSKYGIFKHDNFGFYGPPTDYYLFPILPEAIKKNSMCFGNEFIYNVNLNHLEKISSLTELSKLFAIFWESSITHEYLNLPMVIDLSYARFLKNVERSGFLNETILFVLSDRGLRFSDKGLNKKFGSEANLPLASILMPPSFRNNYSKAFKNIKSNSRRLTTPFDIHATLIDLIDLNAIKNNEIKARTTINYDTRRGISLFLTVPEKRTCQLADIEKRWCACKHTNKKSKKIKKKNLI